MFNFHIWPLCRNDLFLKLNKGDFSRFKENNSSKNTYYQSKFEENKSHILFYLENLYSVKANDIFIDRVCDYKINKLSEYNNLLFYKNNKLMNKKVFTNFLYIQSFMCFVFNFLKNANTVFLLLKLYKNIFGLLFSIFYSFKIYFKLCYVHVAAKRIKGIIQILNITDFYTSNYYNTINYAFVLAFSRCKRSTYNLQHGNQSFYHCAFHPFHNVPEKGYDLVPKYFICTDLNSSKSIELWKPFRPQVIIENSSPNIVTENQRKNTKFTILITLHPRIGISPSIILKVISLSVQFPIIWMIRPHPRFDVTEVQSIYKSYPNCFISDPSCSDIYFALSNCNLHITGFSSSFINANTMKIKTYFIDKRALNYYNNYDVENFLFTNSHELLSNILKESSNHQSK